MTGLKDKDFLVEMLEMVVLLVVVEEERVDTVDKAGEGRSHEEEGCRYGWRSGGRVEVGVFGKLCGDNGYSSCMTSLVAEPIRKTFFILLPSDCLLLT